MSLLYKRRESTRITMVSPERISPNPDQPRRYFDPEALRELADSIRLYGVLQPLTVRRKGGGRFELIAGERRLRASILCGLTEVPCLVMEAGREDACLLSLIENLQRRDLDFWEEAKALGRIIGLYGLSQEEVARRVGKSQSAVANKLRLLKLPETALELLRKNGCTERHARALLRLPDEKSQQVGAELAVKHHWTVQRTEQYVEEVLHQEQTPRRSLPVKDIRFFLNTLDRNLTVMRSAGVEVQCQKREEADSVLLTIRIPKKRE